MSKGVKKSIVQFKADGVTKIAEFDSVTAAAQSLGKKHNSTISMHLTNYPDIPFAYGFVWKYKDEVEEA